ncbi:hypothetical protein RI103_38505 (plasmid) [Paraburkholderia sp. FT54]|uniref:hypothetical protein n=1 Tax=Paraburkholderia sp. FT54 TaxID=3074437 RepID=UPI002877D30A|nr:hypothetical protein [Paraburkholderia sp. FT54]WNC95185.1 hypothetical protein RI103_38505 [Paraburkholderia sp. FT54]
MAKFTLPVWEDWKKLTEFFALSDHVFGAQARAWSGLPLADAATAELRIGSGDCKFESTGDRFATVLADRHMLATVVLLHSYGLMQVAMSEAYEELAKISHANTPLRTQYLANNDCIANLVKNGGVEVWGTQIMNDIGRDWSEVESKKAGLVEAAVVRNALAHGQRHVSQSMMNRVAQANGTLPWPVGDAIVLSVALTKEYRHRFRSLMRVVDHGVYELA